MSLLSKSKTYRYIKTGKIYTLIGTARDCTNITDGRLMALYHPEDQPNFPLVREMVEFCDKFVEVW